MKEQSFMDHFFVEIGTHFSEGSGVNGLFPFRFLRN